MKNRSSFLLSKLFLSSILLGSSAIASAQAPVWSEEFDGERINRDLWSFTTGGGGNGNGELQFYTAASENAYLEDGSLVIEARREQRDGNQFTSARLHTNGRMGFKFGRLEARIKLPQLNDGLWPAFWMLGNNFGLDGWPKCGEWDILEAGSKAARDAGTTNRTVSGALHWWHETGDWGDWLQADHAEETTLADNLYEDYHTYTLDWTPETVTMSVDGVEFFAQDITDPNLSEFRTDPAHIILNLAVGGFNFVEITDPAAITAPFPAKMYVDYVRLYDNGYTQLQLAEDNEFSDTFGIMTETTPTFGELNWGDRTNLFVWNNMADVATTPSEGSSALAYDIAPGDWWGMGLLHRDYNMSNYVHGYLHLDLKTSSTTDITIGITSTSGGGGEVTLVAGAEEYGLSRDGEWHHVAIPLAKFGGVDWQTVKTLFSVYGPAPAEAMNLAIDNIYLTESIALEAPEYGSYGIYTETPEHRSAGDFGFGVSGDLFIWEDTLTLLDADPAEGNSALNLASTGKGWFGMGLTAREGFNLTAFDNADAKLHFRMKTTDQTPFQIGLKGGNVDVIGQKWIYFTPGNDPYGFQRDGAWHEIVVPVATDIARDVDLFDVRQVFQVLGVGEINNLSIDDVYLSGGLDAKIPGTTGPVVNRPPTAAFIPSTAGGQVGVTVDFDGSKSGDVNGDALTYSWDFGDGNSAQGVAASHTFSRAGNFKVTLTVNDGELSTTATNYIIVDEHFGQQRSVKRGLGYGHHSEADLAAISQGISWWYNWSHSPDVMVADIYQNYGMEFVPMAWNGGFDDAGMRAYIAAHPEVKYILAFNEPNFLHQANMTPSQAAAEWPRLEAIADEFGLKIVSVAMNFCGECVTENGTTYYDPIDYFDDFFAVCPDCRVDAMSIHAYMENVQGVEWYVDLFKKYGRPIWMTEFSAWDDTTTLEDQKKFLVQVVDSFENDEDVERYAWFTGRRNGHPYNGLFDYRQSGVLTELGSVYINMPVHNESTVHSAPKLIEAENYQRMETVRLDMTQDDSGFLNLSDIVAGSWVEYNVASAGGTYDLDLRVASVTGGTLEVLVDGQSQGVVTVDATGGMQEWATTESSIHLPAGTHDVRLVFNDEINLNWINIAEGGVINTPTPTPTPTATPTPTPTPTVTPPPGGNLACTAVGASTVEAAWNVENVCDGDAGTRWSSEWADPQWITVDFGETASLSRVTLVWEAAYGSAYELQMSDDATNWSTVTSVSGADGGTDTLDVSDAVGRYLRVYMTERGTGWGYSLFEIQANGYFVNVEPTPTPTATPTPTPTPTATPTPTPTPNPDPVKLSCASATASSVEGAYSAAMACDEDLGTRWSSEFSDPQWIALDMGEVFTFASVELTWEAAFGSVYEIQVSDDGASWTTVFTETAGDGGVDHIALANASGRFIRMLGSQRGAVWGYSLFDFSVYGTSGETTFPPTPGVNKALNKLVTASSMEGPGTSAEAAVDGNPGSRWSSQFNDGEWIAVDLGAMYSLSSVLLDWEGAYGLAYEIQVSNDGEQWNTVFTENNSDGGIDEIPLSTSGRYVRMQGVVRATGWGYSLWEFEVY
ncbi:Beta-glucanase [Thalassocella blandensis]|nr:Beta-glucanase [Thalassocella blandensis]